MNENDELLGLAVEREDIIEVGGLGSPEAIQAMMPVDAEAAMGFLV